MEARVLDRYRLEKLLGSGSFGTVYRAEDERLPGRIVAIKILNTHFAQIEAERARFQREAAAMAELHGHPHIVGITDIGETDEGIPCFVMEYLPESLRDRLGRVTDETAPGSRLGATKTVTSEQAVTWVKQVCDALEYTHERKMIHRDLKPENLLLTEKESIKVADFGIAQVQNKYICCSG